MFIRWTISIFEPYLFVFAISKFEHDMFIRWTISRFKTDLFIVWIISRFEPDLFIRWTISIVEIDMLLGSRLTLCVGNDFIRSMRKAYVSSALLTVANKWIWTAGNIFRRRCGLSPNATQLDIEGDMQDGYQQRPG